MYGSLQKRSNSKTLIPKKELSSFYLLNSFIFPLLSIKTADISILREFKKSTESSYPRSIHIVLYASASSEFSVIIETEDKLLSAGYPVFGLIM